MFIEPAWKMVLSNKGILAILWDLFPGHPNLLPAFFNEPNGMFEYVKKPLLSREGANVTVHTMKEHLESTGEYGAEGYVFQQLAPIPEFDGKRPVIGSLDHRAGSGRDGHSRSGRMGDGKYVAVCAAPIRVACASSVRLRRSRPPSTHAPPTFDHARPHNFLQKPRAPANSSVRSTRFAIASAPMGRRAFPPWPVGTISTCRSRVPWAHRAIIVRKLLGLEDVISMSVVDPIRDERGWAFREGDGHTAGSRLRFSVPLRGVSTHRSELHGSLHRAVHLGSRSGSAS